MKGFFVLRKAQWQSPKSWALKFAIPLAVLFVTCVPPTRSQTPALSILTWAQNTPDSNAVLGVTSIRLGCSAAPSTCFGMITQVASSQDVQRLFLSIQMDPNTAANYAAQYSQWSLTNPVLFSVGFDDLVNKMEHLQTDFGISQPGTVIDQTIKAAKSANPNIKFAVTLYEDSLNSPLLGDSNLPPSTRAGVDYVQLYVHYREDGPNYAAYLQQAKSLFPNAKIIAGAYAYDRIDYLPCSPNGVPCTPEQDASLFQQLLVLQLQELQQGLVDQIEFYPGYFGLEDQWPGWSEPRRCASARVPTCIANTIAMRQGVVQALNSAFGPPGPLTSLSPRPLEFPVQDVSTTSGASTVTLHNPGSAPLSISDISIVGSDASDFSQQNSCPGSLAVNASCSIAVQFAPSAVGSRTSQLSVADDARRSPHLMDLGGVGAVSSAPQILLSPTSLNFKDQTVGATSSPLAILVSNVGGSNLNIAGIAVSGTSGSQFVQTSNCVGSISPQGTCTISVTFTPSAADILEAQLVITDNAVGSPQTIPLMGAGTEPAGAQVLLSSSVLSFGNQAVNAASASQSVSLTSQGPSTTLISGVTLAGTNASDFSQTNTCGSSLGVGNSCALSIAFKPSGAGPRSAQVLIADNATGSPQSISLSGTGAANTPPASTPVVMLAPASVNFGNQSVGGASPASTVMLTNSGNAALAVTGVAISGANAPAFAQSNTCVGTVAAGSNCSISIVFTPTAAGTDAAQIVITDDAANSPQQIALSGAGANAVSSDFAISGTPLSSSIASGQSAKFTLSLSVSGGFSQPVQFACSGLPAGASCSFSPASITPAKNSAVTTTMTVATLPRTGAAFRLPEADPPSHAELGLGIFTACLILCLFGARTSARTRAPLSAVAALVLAALAAGSLAGCGAVSTPTSSSGGATGTPAGTYMISVTASAGNLTHQVDLSLTVK